MFWDLRDILLGMHIAAAIVWVGSVLFIGWGVFPAAKTIPVRDRQRFLLKLMKRSHFPFAAAGVVVIITGVFLGTVTGPLDNWQLIWATTYGRIWLAALLIAMFILLWGVFIGYRYTIKKLSDPVIWKTAANGSESALRQAFVTIALAESVEGLGFIVLIGLMISF